MSKVKSVAKLTFIIYYVFACPVKVTFQGVPHSIILLENMISDNVEEISQARRIAIIFAIKTHSSTKFQQKAKWQKL